MKIETKIIIGFTISSLLLLIFSCTNEFDYGKFQNAVKTIDLSNLTQTTVDISGTVITDNGESLNERGICYGTSINPTISDNKNPYSTADLGDFSCTLNNLLPSTTYYARAYATNSYGTAYGESITFTTLVALKPIISSTTSANLITATSAKTGGIIIHSGASSVTSRGVCYSNSVAEPTILNSKTLDGTGIGTFISSLSSLTTNTTYYIRAYATNSNGTGYGDVKSFVTTSATAPTGITTTIASSISLTSSNSGGSITSDGGATISAKGVCWSSTTTNPNILNSKTIDGTGTGTFISNLTNLNPGTTYFVKAYATNIAGTTYGNTVTFTTVSPSAPSGITTTPISSITQTTASSGGSITSDGGATITAKGVCWSSTNSTPSISDSFVNNGTGTTLFTSSLTNLTANTTYYVRAFATNSAGTNYGNTVSFITLPNLAVGQSYQGGIIAYIFVAGDSGYVSGQTHGLIATTANQSTGAQWGCSGTSIATNTTLGTGNANTTSIVSGCATTTNAAAICSNLSSGGYTDWYLPSFTELNKLYINKTSIGGFIAASYWCSSQSSATAAYSINFSTGTGISTSTKITTMYVRAIRSF